MHAGDSRFNMALVVTNHILGCIKHSTEIQSEELILPLYLALQQPHLDYCMQIWSLQFKNNVQVLESTQRWATKLIKDVKGMSCCSIETSDVTRTGCLSEGVT